MNNTVKTISTLEDLLTQIDELSPKDQVVIEDTDEDGDTIDLYPFYVDVIEGIKLANGDTVREIRFTKLPNTPPKAPLIEAIKRAVHYELGAGGILKLERPIFYRKEGARLYEIERLGIGQVIIVAQRTLVGGAEEVDRFRLNYTELSTSHILNIMGVVNNLLEEKLLKTN